jgi:hypothetical protein
LISTGEEKEILLRRKVCAYLTCRLVGDPEPLLPFPGFCDRYGREAILMKLKRLKMHFPGQVL